MSANTASFHDLASIAKLTISFKLLLSLYLIIPICVGLQFLDIGLWHEYLKSHLPSSPGYFLLFQILFGTPHIIASAIIMVSNADYWQFYQRKIGIMTVILAAFFGIGSLFIPYKALYILVAAWTVLHVLKQQHGVARGICRLSTWAYHLLLWLSVLAGTFIYIGIFLKNSLDVQQVEWLKHIISSLCIGLVGSGILCQRQIKTSLGKLFMWANILLILSSFYFYNQQYYFFAILIPRLVHDVTAYIFYTTHDYNKHNNNPQNFIYKISKTYQLPIFIVLPVMSFLLAFVLQAYGDIIVNQLINYLFGIKINKAVTLGLLGYFALMHYYTESITWKQDSPYRKYIGFS